MKLWIKFDFDLFNMKSNWINKNQGNLDIELRLVLFFEVPFLKTFENLREFLRDSSELRFNKFPRLQQDLD